MAKKAKNAALVENRRNEIKQIALARAHPSSSKPSAAAADPVAKPVVDDKPSPQTTPAVTEAAQKHSDEINATAPVRHCTV